MNVLSAFIVGFPAPVRLSTTNADSAFVVATKDSPVTNALQFFHASLGSATTDENVVAGIGEPGYSLFSGERPHRVATKIFESAAP